MNYYEVLDVNKNSSLQDIKKQYKKLALKHHPDRGGDPEQFKKISEAYQILSDPQKRAEYDNPSPFAANMPSGRCHHPGFVDPDELFKHFFGSGFGNVHGIHGMPRGGQVFQRSVSTTIRGNMKIETVTETKNGVRTETTTQTNMKTGQSQRQVKQISG
jgi:DnaJ family protein A protein 2